MSAADVKMEIPVLVQSLKMIILSSTSSQLDDSFLGEVNAAVEQSRHKAMERGNSAFDAYPRIPPNRKYK